MSPSSDSDDDWSGEVGGDCAPELDPPTIEAKAAARFFSGPRTAGARWMGTTPDERRHWRAHALQVAAATACDLIRQAADAAANGSEEDLTRAYDRIQKIITELTGWGSGRRAALFLAMTPDLMHPDLETPESYWLWFLTLFPEYEQTVVMQEGGEPLIRNDVSLRTWELLAAMDRRAGKPSTAWQQRFPNLAGIDRWKALESLISKIGVKSEASSITLKRDIRDARRAFRDFAGFLRARLIRPFE